MPIHIAIDIGGTQLRAAHTTQTAWSRSRLCAFPPGMNTLPPGTIAVFDNPGLAEG